VLQANDCNYLVKFYGAFFYEGMVKLAVEYMDLGSIDRIILKSKEKKKLIPEKIVCKITIEVQ